MFERYGKDISTRIIKLLCSEIDSNVKLNIIDPKKITENFIREIRIKNVSTWRSLQPYINSPYFYDQCIEYINVKIEDYKKRYSEVITKGKISEEMVNFLAGMIEKGLKHPDYKTRMQSISELKNMINMLSKGSGSYYIDKFKNILNISKNESKEDNIKKEGSEKNEKRK